MRCRTPAKARDGAFNIPKWMYDVISTAILDILKKEGEISGVEGKGPQRLVLGKNSPPAFNFDPARPTLARMSKHYAKPKGPSQRQLRAGELIRHALVEIFQREDLRDPALAGVSITVSEVRASPDLKAATAYCAPLGSSVGATDQGVTAALNKLAPHLRHLLGQKIELKHTPALTFRNDQSFSEASKIDELLASPDVKRDLNAGD